MCGIAGIFHFGKAKVENATLKAMTDAIVHRGPDGEGHWVNPSGKIGLGHRRLSVIDLTLGGKQPMHLLEERYTITFNGEIYNYKELREDLAQQGLTFHSQSDTEVLLALFHVHREACLNLLDGMFAFAIWDELTQELFCARDRFGEKPFHYYLDENRFVFGSEIKELFAAGVSCIINRTAIQEFLNRHLVERGEETFFDGIRKLKHAHYLLIKNGNVEQKCYYNPDIYRKAPTGNEADYAQRFRELFTTGLRRRLRSDVPIGSSLSGGLDSSTVVCFTAKELGDATIRKTFSARFNGPKDEGKWIKIASEAAGTQHHEVYPDPKHIKEDIQKMVWHHEYPFGSSSICASWYVMQLARKNNVIVLLDGQGADEYLSGYPIMKNYLLMQYLFKGQIRKFIRTRKAYKRLYGQQYPLGKMWWAHPVLQLLGHPKSAFYHARTFKQRLHYETMHRLQELLAYADRTSMAFSLEVRLPFLYHELVDYTLSVPDEQLYHHGKTKYILRNAIRGTVPDAITDRIDKIGYEPPENDWIKQLFDPNEVRSFLQQNGYSPGEGEWRNYIAMIFLMTFDQRAN